jgi:hypothetical protein
LKGNADWEALVDEAENRDVIVDIEEALSKKDAAEKIPRQILATSALPLREGIQCKTKPKRKVHSYKSRSRKNKNQGPRL